MSMILHIDMDAFFAAIEQLDNPELKGKPVIIGGSSKRGVVSTASYEAREYGVHSAMPIFQAKKKCPNGIYIPGRMKRYKELSGRIMEILREFSPLVEPVSIDEAYIDVAGCKKLFGQPEQIAKMMKDKIKKDTGLSCSIGVAPNKFLAKIASDMDKPDGITIIQPEEMLDFIDTLPIRKVSGVGKVTFRQLEQLGIETLGDIKSYPEKTLLKKLGKFGKKLIKLSSCIDDSSVNPRSGHKSISTERTLSVDTADVDLLKKYLLKQSEEVAGQLRKIDKRGKTINLKIKHSDFKQITRSVTPSLPTNSSKTIYQESAKLLDKYNLSKKVRLIGVGVSGLVSNEIPIQMDLFSEKIENNGSWQKIDSTIDKIKEKFGKDIVQRASLQKQKEKKDKN